MIKDGLTDSAAIKVALQVVQLIPARKEAAGPTLPTCTSVVLVKVTTSAQAAAAGAQC